MICFFSTSRPPVHLIKEKNKWINYYGIGIEPDPRWVVLSQDHHRVRIKGGADVFCPMDRLISVFWGPQVLYPSGRTTDAGGILKSLRFMVPYTPDIEKSPEISTRGSRCSIWHLPTSPPRVGSLGTLYGRFKAIPERQHGPFKTPTDSISVQARNFLH